MVDRQPFAPAAFTPGETPGTHFQRPSRPQDTWFCRKEPRKKSPFTPPGNVPGTVRLVAQRNKYLQLQNKIIAKCSAKLEKQKKERRSKFAVTPL
jgi:hypothetical protein